MRQTNDRKEQDMTKTNDRKEQDMTFEERYSLTFEERYASFRRRYMATLADRQTRMEKIRTEWRRMKAENAKTQSQMLPEG